MRRPKIHSREMREIFNTLNAIMWNWEEKKKIFSNIK